MLRTYLADCGSTATERLVLSSYVPDEVAERTREERHRQTMMQVNRWAQLCKGNSPSISSDDRSEQVVIPAGVETEMAIEHPS